MDGHLFICVMVCCVLLVSATVINGFKLTILHTNDVHARFEQFNKFGSDCSQSDVDEGKCFGGVARRFTKIQEIRGNHDNVLLLDAGDQFMGTMFFSVHRGMATSYFMNLLGYDAMCLGNHEFDIRVEPLARFLDNVTFPAVSCNTNVSMEPRLQGKFTKSLVTTINGETIGIIGYTTPETAQISTPGPTISFGEVVECVEAEVKAMQGQKINKIIALGHAGFATDKQVAAIDGVDIVVGGHSNTFLYNGEQPSTEDAIGPYPVVVNQPDGGKGLAVQDYMWGKYLGYINVTFDENGIVTDYTGNPILLDGSVIQDASILQHVETWKAPLKQQMSSILGSSNVILSSEGEICMLQECNIGNMITDSIIEYHVNYSHPVSQWAPCAVAFWNGGGVRSSVDKGQISNGELLNVMPFGNEIDLLTLKGENIREQLEWSVAAIHPGQEPHGRFLQMSGMRVVYDLDMPVGQRVTFLEVRCLECDVPSYSPLLDNKDYKVFMSNFIYNGGDGYKFKPSNIEPFNTLDNIPVTSYIKRRHTIYTGLEGRIRYEKRQTSGGRANSVACFAVVISVILSHNILIY